MGDWSTTTLAAYADVISRYSRAADVLNAEGDPQEQIEVFIGRAKVHIGRLLDAELRHLWSRFDLEDVTDLKDLILNPQVLKQACVAWTLKLMFEESSYAEEDYYYKRMKDFDREFQTELRIALSLIEYDSDQSGDADESEKQNSPAGNRFMRV